MVGNILARACLRDARKYQMTAAQAQTDAELLDHFASGSGEAFELLVRRHGPMVLRVCQRVLCHTQDAEDAFQAAFVVLARKGAAIARRQLLANWLYGVAYRIALKARRSAQRRLVHELRRGEQLPTEAPNELLLQDLRPFLDAELDRLPA